MRSFKRQMSPSMRAHPGATEALHEELNAATTKIGCDCIAHWIRESRRRSA